MEPTVPAPRPAIAERTFRTVLRGYDPKEVREYLEMLDRSAVMGGDAEARLRAEAMVAAATAEAERIVAEAQRRADGLDQEAALRTWFGPDHAVPGDGVGDRAPEADRAAAIVAEAEAEAAAIVARAHEQAQAVSPADGGVARWDDLGEHVARVLGQAEAEARALVQAAEAEARSAAGEAEQQRLVAATVVTEAETEAARIRAEVEAAAAQVVDQAAPRARAHIHEVLALAHDELDRTRSALTAARAQLAEIHVQLGRSLAASAPTVDLADAETLVAPLVADLPSQQAAVAVAAGPGSALHHVIDLSGVAPPS